MLLAESAEIENLLTAAIIEASRSPAIRTSTRVKPAAKPLPSFALGLWLRRGVVAMAAWLLLTPGSR